MGSRYGLLFVYVDRVWRIPPVFYRSFCHKCEMCIRDRVFGDGENDKRMFREFAHSCAVKNAVPAVRKLAEKIIESNEENGVAKEINRILECV